MTTALSISRRPCYTRPWSIGGVPVSKEQVAHISPENAALLRGFISINDDGQWLSTKALTRSLGLGDNWLPHVRYHLRKLARKQLVETRVADGDKRVREHKLTDEGKAIGTMARKPTWTPS